VPLASPTAQLAMPLLPVLLLLVASLPKLLPSPQLSAPSLRPPLQAWLLFPPTPHPLPQAQAQTLVSSLHPQSSEPQMSPLRQLVQTPLLPTLLVQEHPPRLSLLPSSTLQQQPPMLPLLVLKVLARTLVNSPEQRPSPVSQHPPNTSLLFQPHQAVRWELLSLSLPPLSPSL
jgi:hypothetical protein